MGLCCMAATSGSPIRTKSAAACKVNGKDTPANLRPKSLKVVGEYTYSKTDSYSKTANSEVYRDTLDCQLKFSDSGLLSQLKKSKSFYFYEMTDSNTTDSDIETTTGLYSVAGTLNFNYNDRNQVDSTNYRLAITDKGGNHDALNCVRHHAYTYDSDGKCMGVNRYYDGGITREDKKVKVEHKQATDSTYETVTTTDLNYVRRYTVLEADSKGVPTKVNYLKRYIGNKQTVDTILDVTLTDIEWTKASNPSKIKDLTLDESPTAYSDATLQNILQNWMNDENQVESFNYTAKIYLEALEMGFEQTGYATAALENDGSVDVQIWHYEEGYALNTGSLWIENNSTSGNIRTGGMGASGLQLYALPTSLPDYMVKFLTDGLTSDDVDYMSKKSPAQFAEPYVVGDRIYTKYPVTVEYNDDGSLKQVKISYSEDDYVSNLSWSERLSYVIDCVYDDGTTGVAQPATDALQWNAIGGNGTITLSGINGNQVAIYAINGRLAYSATVANSATVGVPAGIYVVKVGAKAVKVIVR